jgi:hypothetical protein
MSPRYTRRELEIADHLWDCLVRIAEDNGTEPHAVLNQAIYDLARRFNFLTPAGRGKDVAMPKGAPPPAAQPQMGAGGAGGQVAKKSAPSLPPKAATASKDTLYVVNSAGEMTKVEKDSFLIGRSRNCDLVIPSSKVSRQHCTVTREAGEFFIEDLGTPNGVWHNGVKVTKEKIKDGDEFMISDEVIKFVYRNPARKQ